MEPVLDRQRGPRLLVPLPSDKNPLNKGPGAGARQPGNRVSKRLLQLDAEPDAADPHRLAMGEIGLRLRSGLEEQQPILPVARGDHVVACDGLKLAVKTERAKATILFCDIGKKSGRVFVSGGIEFQKNPRLEPRYRFAHADNDRDLGARGLDLYELAPRARARERIHRGRRYGDRARLR